ncbi:MAG: hypothetical protein Q4F57_03220 [Weeksellaceae bacterium]|nr:hypothetical protein [Weeksellaceae bacterium]
MKTSVFKISALGLLLAGSFSFAQVIVEDQLEPVETPTMREYLAPEKYNRNVFEDPKGNEPEFNGVHVSVGGDFALQFQGLSHSTAGVTVDGAPIQMRDLGTDFNLPTANLDLNAYLAKGVKMHLRTYLSARHHNEAWVKGGYIQIDNLDFISPGFMGNVMDHLRVKVGMDDINFGDNHFRRTDNARAITNMFVGNNIMDAFTTEPFLEVYGHFNDMFVMGGISNGKLNQNVVLNPTSDNAPTLYAKVGYDKQINPDLRFRLTGSLLKSNGLTTGQYLYGADRAGSRYYYVLLDSEAALGTSNYTTGRFNPGFREMLAFQINPFVKYRGLEFFGTIENVTGNRLVNPTTRRDSDGNFMQLAGELIYRFGNAEQYYVGGKYNTVSGKDWDNADNRNINRFNLAAGWFMTPNVLAKLEYVNQNYNESAAWGNTPLYGGKFNGVMLEATIGF